ncbi:hypothetical protein EOA75_24830 [Mesorhizobium sp. M1A.F.Ca.IN.022.07.1.1]|uniref:hypothetical protein n=1 Tax=unclassified Mesorhizobium TaxID=325217 RepID=UPI000F74E9F7|nr:MULTISPECIES: hypothetical protein [unclassified Mesorhizobium]AZO63023.1 hypothetical protein EJ078_30185 [Mesorhizobium sp. M1A.F.Ca.IN.022.06.1.1]RUV87982.1 hypothetical protein EOA75_24830 [Mesorhizobium sp. M1A.F.Ca.IN.022.07.1.1]RWH31136.1 MAG: hypothetical protein EOQ76_09730 [Mesorhizobium sp.]RWH39585.1 MAG: hypothetical protein EOQ79_07305 [Mesorhizobium sp.]TIM67348.1 MAG: hypothetical protein E5Y52_11825 [Mesorhizobium sp.]
MTAELAVSIVALIVSIIALGMSVFFWRRQFRPIVTAMVQTHHGGNDGIAYNLVVLNSGSIPARNIRLVVRDQAALEAALGAGADAETRGYWLACFEPSMVIRLLQNGAQTTCSFGLTHRIPKKSFWKAQAEFPIQIEYEGWFGERYRDDPPNILQIADSDSFTGGMWGPVKNDSGGRVDLH